MFLLSILSALFPGKSRSESALQPGAFAPTFETQTGDGKLFKLTDRKGKWTVLYFYPKDDTPGCTKQACAFRDSIDVIRKEGAEVYGVSKDSVDSHKKFVEKYHLNFPILADPEGKIIQSYGVSGMMGYAKRWTFLIGPDLTIRHVERDVDPAMDAKRVAELLNKLK